MYQNCKKLSEKGFTFLEVLMSMAILMVLFPLIANFMIHSYSKLSNTNAFDNELNDFRLSTTSISKELLFSDSIIVEHHNGYDLLNYTNYSGRAKSYIFDYAEGMFVYDVYTKKKEFITEIKPYDKNMNFIEMKDDLIQFNVYAYKLNALMFSEVSSRKNEVFK